ncbi:hypothetical protein [Flavobacterium chungangense]|uniref:hypothetical protein n=1 Tax=Flavobacterium chungangense TaxID=554283 RepID=UPI0012FAA895|nr:hypothetical protein [Flavobacterium chungangense]
MVFKNKTFNCSKLIFENYTHEDLYVHFYDCTFNCELEFDTCEFEDLTFISCDIQRKYLVIVNSNINYLSFKENTNDIRNVKTNNIKNGEIEINGGKINSIDIENINFEKGNLKIVNLDSIENCSIIRSTLNSIIISHCNFKSHFEYFGNKTASSLNSALFNHCVFNHSSFFKTTFNSDTKFSDCKFLNIAKFEATGDEIKTTLKFDDCEFLKQVSFNKSRIHKISFNNLKFFDIISLQETYFDIVDIDRTIFEKQVYFDDIQIKQIYKCNIRTIRTIKLQLQKAENKIDYNRFRIYEFNAFRDDIKKKLKEFEKDKDHLNHRAREPKQLNRDLFILNISDIVSEYGTDWKRAMKFTLLVGSIIYILFFICENYDHEITLCDWNNWKRFISGAFRFFLVTDFYTPLENDRTYLTNPLSWFIFIIGKIVIAFGIYEMIQSFRKFKA